MKYKRDEGAANIIAASAIPVALVLVVATPRAAACLRRHDIFVAAAVPTETMRLNPTKP